jgi:hypothetical protein
MGLIDKILRRTVEPAVAEATAGYLQTVTAYSPVFTSFAGGVYEAELCRAAIHTFATHCSKLKPEISGSKKSLQYKLLYRPNFYMDTTKFLYKAATILEAENTCFIIPLNDQRGNITGFFPVSPINAEIKAYEGKRYLAYKYYNEKRAEELSKVGIMNKFFYRDDFVGETNNALMPTISLMNTQNQAIEEGAKNSAVIRFIAQINKTLKSSDIAAERTRFMSENLSASNNGGVLLFDTKYSDVKPINSTPYFVPPNQAEMIRGNVFDYFGVNENIIRNEFGSDDDNKWEGYYEGKIEPFALQLSLVMTNMVYGDKANKDNEIMFSSNRLQIAPTKTKVEYVTSMFDRGLITQNQANEVFNMPKVKGGDKYYIRKEYMEKGKEDANKDE